MNLSSVYSHSKTKKKKKKKKWNQLKLVNRLIRYTVYILSIDRERKEEEDVRWITSRKKTYFWDNLLLIRMKNNNVRIRTRKDKFREVPVGRQIWWLMVKDRDFRVWSWLYLQHSSSFFLLFERNESTHKWPPSFESLLWVKQRERACKREREKRDPLFLILLSTLMSSTLEVQEHSSLTVKDISRSCALSLSLSPSSFPSPLYFSYIVLFSMLLPPFGQSAMRKEKE